MAPDDLFRDALKLTRSLKAINVEPTTVILKRDDFDRLRAYCTQHGYVPFHTDGNENSILGVKIVVEE